jgi:hypothetical protein
VAGLDHLDVPRGQAMLVARHGHAFQRSRKILLYSDCHGRRGLAGGGDEGAALGRRRQMRAEDLQRVGGRDCRAEALFEDRPQPKVSFAASAPSA